jgi:hypothetical protein
VETLLGKSLDAAAAGVGAVGFVAHFCRGCGLVGFAEWWWLGREWWGCEYWVWLGVDKRGLDGGRGSFCCGEWESWECLGIVGRKGREENREKC